MGVAAHQEVHGWKQVIRPLMLQPIMQAHAISLVHFRGISLGSHAARRLLKCAGGRGRREPDVARILFRDVSKPVCKVRQKGLGGKEIWRMDKVRYGTVEQVNVKRGVNGPGGGCSAFIRETIGNGVRRRLHDYGVGGGLGFRSRGNSDRGSFVVLERSVSGSCRVIALKVVSPHVSEESVFAGIRLGAELTRERSLVGVGAQMALEMLHLTKDAVAHGAGCVSTAALLHHGYRGALSSLGKKITGTETAQSARKK